MDSIDFLDLAASQKKELEEEKNKRPYNVYLQKLLQQYKDGEDVIRSTVTSSLPSDDGLYVCLKEPLDFLKVFDRISNNKEACCEEFKRLVDNRDRSVIDQVVSSNYDAEGMWFNSTSKGVNLRPGLRDNDVTRPEVTSIGNPEDNVHAIIVGATGSGKSVFLHNLLFSMMAEYAPWELNLYLIDFKKVSLSKYLSQCDTPHVKAVAATSEVRYVVSLLTKLNEYMRARQTFFSYLGIEKLDQLRKKYKIILPRVVVMVDEFQQMFSDATAREADKINEILTSITKLGRATGFHLVFASQEMNGTLSQSAFANFKIRFALRCTRDVSTAFLGNPAAAQIGDKEVGIVKENSKDGKEDTNRTFKIPFVEENGLYFYEFLEKQTELATQAGFSTIHKYYQEDFISPFSTVEGLLSNEKIKDYKKKLLKENPNYNEVLTLGDAVVFNNKKVDCETVFLERGSKKNIGVFCPELKNLSYVCRLLATNFKLSPFADRYRNIAFILNDLFERSYPIADDLVIPSNCIYHTNSDIHGAVFKLINQRKKEMQLLQQFDKYKRLDDFAKAVFLLHAQYIGINTEKFQSNDNSDEFPSLNVMCSHFEESGIEDIPSVCSTIKNDYPKYERYINNAFRLLNMVYRAKTENETFIDQYDPYVVWIIGSELAGSFSYEEQRQMAEAPNYRILFVIAGSSVAENFSDLYDSCDYLFISGNQEQVYNRWDIPYTNKSEDSKVIDFKVRSAGTQRSFKKYFLESDDVDLPSIPFDDLLE